jgi:hypothetical protein
VRLFAPLTTTTPRIALHNQRASPLLRLPAELRNQIYEYVLTFGVWFINENTGYADPCDAQPGVLSLLSVCRQIYHETEFLALRLNAIYFTEPPNSFFFSRLTMPQRAAITHVTVDTYIWHHKIGASVSAFGDQITLRDRQFQLLASLPALRTLDVLINGRDTTNEQMAAVKNWVKRELGRENRPEVEVEVRAEVWSNGELCSAGIQL